MALSLRFFVLLYPVACCFPVTPSLKAGKLFHS